MATDPRSRELCTCVTGSTRHPTVIGVEDKPRPKAVILLSGGLDSTLAATIMQQRGIELLGLNFISPFCLCDRVKGCRRVAREVARRLGIPMSTVSLTREYVRLLRNPRYGFGSNVNPCIDCRILMFRKARQYMERKGCSFIVTGEVLDQRPMTQRRGSMAVIEREAGVQGLVVRPLSDALLPPSTPEKAGLVKREWMSGIQGRSRKDQIAMATGLGLDYYACPAGGCLLTDPSFAPRVRDLLSHASAISGNDLLLLRYGRHFRLSPKAKAVVGRCEDENVKLGKLAQRGDILLETVEHPGPLTVLRGSMTEQDIESAARIQARYSDVEEDGLARVTVKPPQNQGLSSHLVVSPASRSEISKLRI